MKSVQYIEHCMELVKYINQCVNLVQYNFALNI